MLRIQLIQSDITRHIELRWRTIHASRIGRRRRYARLIRLCFLSVEASWLLLMGQLLEVQGWRGLLKRGVVWPLMHVGEGSFVASCALVGLSTSVDRERCV